MIYSSSKGRQLSCPHCGRHLEDDDLENFVNREASGATALPGDLMICPDCVLPSMFTFAGGLRLLTTEENTPLVRSAVGLVETMKFGPFRA